MYSDESDPRAFQSGRDHEDLHMAAYLVVIDAALQSQAANSGKAASKLREELVKAKAVLDSKNTQ